MIQVRYEVQYSQDTKRWYRYLDRYDTVERATAKAQEKRYNENHTRVVKVMSEVIETFAAIPGKPAPPMIVPGLGEISFKS